MGGRKGVRRALVQLGLLACGGGMTAHAAGPDDKAVRAPAVEVVAPTPLPGLGVPPADSLSPALLAHYAQTISDALARHREYPRLAQLRGWQGVVTMRLHIAQSGRLLSAEVHTSSGHESLDRQAIAMAWVPERLPPLPHGVPDQEVTVLVPIVFRLTR